MRSLRQFVARRQDAQLASVPPPAVAALDAAIMRLEKAIAGAETS